MRDGKNGSVRAFMITLSKALDENCAKKKQKNKMIYGINICNILFYFILFYLFFYLSKSVVMNYSLFFFFVIFSPFGFSVLAAGAGLAFALAAVVVSFAFVFFLVWRFLPFDSTTTSTTSFVHFRLLRLPCCFFPILILLFIVVVAVVFFLV